MELKVERSLALPGTPERVWKGWTEDLNRWWVRPFYNDAERVTGLRFEPWAGGRFLEEWGPNGEGFLIGHVVQWLPPLRLAYTWTETRWAGISTLVTIDLAPKSGGQTHFHLVQSGFERLPDGEKMREGYASGHLQLVGRLEEFLRSDASA